MPNFDNPARRTTAQRLNRAAPWRHDDRMEALAEMREKDPAGFRLVSASQLIALGLYESDKATHDHLTGGDAA